MTLRLIISRSVIFLEGTSNQLDKYGHTCSASNLVLGTMNKGITRIVKGLFCTNPIYINMIDKVRQNPIQ